MNVGSPLYGVHFGFPSGVAPIDPKTVPSVVRVMYYSSPYPLKRDSTPAGPLDPAPFTYDQLAAGGFPIDRADNIDDPTTCPIFRTDGLQLDTLGLLYYLTTNATMEAGLGSFTAYAWGTLAGDLVALGNSGATQAAIYCASTQLFLVDDTTSVFVNTTDTIPAGLFLFRVSYDATTGDYNLQATGSSGATGNVGAGFTFTFNMMGAALGLGESNGSVDNRHMGQLVFSDVIPFGGATDLGLRAGISAGTFTGKPGYSL